MDEISLSLKCYKNARGQWSIAPVGNEYNGIHRWPDCIYT